MPDFRQTPGFNPQWFSTNGSFSNFDFVDTRFGSDPILRRILSLARKLKFQGLLLEEIHETDCALLAEENQALARRLPAFSASKVFRLNFFTGDREGQPGELLGYAVFKSDMIAGRAISHVYEAVLKLPRRHEHNNFVHCAKVYTIRTALGQHAVRGVLYAQQNNATFVCAHVALRTMLACLLPEGDFSYTRMNQLAGVDHGDPARQVGQDVRGLETPQLEAILRGCGLDPIFEVNEPGTADILPPEVEFQRLLYGYLESNCSALVGFELGPDPVNGGTGRHIIPIFGHTFNEDLWAPEAERFYFDHNSGYFPSESWLSSYVGHDDNFGPYICLPRHYLNRRTFRLLISTYPPGVTLPPDEAEAVALSFARQLVAKLPVPGIPWLDRFAAFCRTSLLVLRTLHLTRADYVIHLGALRDRDNYVLEPALIGQLTAHLPENFWLVEVSAPELFPASRRKFGEMLVGVEPDAGGVPRLLAARLPGVVVFVNGTNFKPEGTRLAGHTALYSYSAL